MTKCFQFFSFSINKSGMRFLKESFIIYNINIIYNNYIFSKQIPSRMRL